MTTKTAEPYLPLRQKRTGTANLMPTTIVLDANGYEFASAYSNGAACRIVACVNACAGMEADELDELAATPNESTREEVSRLQSLINAIERRIRKVEHG